MKNENVAGGKSCQPRCEMTSPGNAVKHFFCEEALLIVAGVARLRAETARIVANSATKMRLRIDEGTNRAQAVSLSVRNARWPNPGQ